MKEIVLTIEHDAGLHARPLAQFVKTVRQFEADVEVSNLTRETEPVRGDSAIKLMLLGIMKGHEIKISAEGVDEEEAINALVTLIENNFE